MTIKRRGQKEQLAKLVGIGFNDRNTGGGFYKTDEFKNDFLVLLRKVATETNEALLNMKHENAIIRMIAEHKVKFCPDHSMVVVEVKR